MALKYLKREDLSPEELKQLDKIYSTFQKKVFFRFLGYLFCAILGTFVIVVVNILFVNDNTFQFFASLGTGVIFMAGLQRSIDELRDILVKEVQKFVKD